MVLVVTKKTTFGAPVDEWLGVNGTRGPAYSQCSGLFRQVEGGLRDFTICEFGTDLTTASLWLRVGHKFEADSFIGETPAKVPNKFLFCGVLRDIMNPEREARLLLRFQVDSWYSLKGCP